MIKQSFLCFNLASFYSVFKIEFFNKIPDEEIVISENILGRVYFIFPGLGKVQFFLASKGGILLAILIPAIAIIGYDIYKISRGLLLKKRMKEIDELEKK